MGSKRVPRALLAAGPVLAESDGHRRLAVGVVAPAGQPAVRPDGAVVVIAGVDAGKGARGRGRLAVRVPAPAGEGAVGPDRAGEGPAGGDRDEAAGRRAQLAVGVVAPADDGAAVLFDSARVGLGGADSRAAEQEPGRRLGLAEVVGAPAGRGSARLDRAGEELAGGDRDESAGGRA